MRRISLESLVSFVLVHLQVRKADLQVNKYFESLRVRLILLVLLAVIPALVLTLYTGLEQRRLAAADVHDEALRLGRLALADQMALIDYARQLLATQAQLPVVREERGRACDGFLADLEERYWRLTGFLVIERNGDVSCSSLAESEPVNLADRSWFRRALETREFTVGEYMIARLDGTPILPLAYPILDEDEQVQAVVATGLDLTRLSLFGAAMQLPSESTLTLIDRDGTVVARYPDPDKWVGRSMPEAPIVREVLTRRGEGTAEAIGVDGIARLFAFVPLQATSENGQSQAADLYIVVGIPTYVAFADVSWIMLRNLAGLGLVAALAIVSAWLVGDLFILRPVNVLSGLMMRVAAADFGGRIGPPYSAGELGQLARIFDRSVMALEQRENERKQVEEELAETRHRLTEAREAERLFLAQELHDGPVQDLLALDFRVVGLEEVLPDGNGLEELERIRATVQDVTRTLRVICGELRPPTLTPFGLSVAMRSHARRVQEEHPELEIGLHLMPDGLALPEQMRLALFRIYQQALDNVLRHADASYVLVRFAMDESQVVLEVRDNGRGFDVPSRWINMARHGHLGVVGASERAEAIGGRLRVESTPGNGTVMWVTAPRPNHREAEA
jgi:signal transduction histidine kinase